MTSSLDHLKQFTTVVADTGDLEAIARLKPEDATTNPSLLLKAAALTRYAELVEQARQIAKDNIDRACDYFAVAVGAEILKLIPGRISTEVDARLSFDTPATVKRAQGLIAQYESMGIGRDRVLIKIAATWEGIRAAQQLEQQGIQTNLTLLFSMAQAVACAEAGVFLISPFVGRISDWYKKQTGETYTAENDPGVLSVHRIYRYYKTHGYKTVVMGASFRSVEQVAALNGCDRLTISPALLEQLASEQNALPRQLDPSQRGEALIKQDEASFRWELNEDAMATEKLAEGIRLFARDQEKLEEVLR